MDAAVALRGPEMPETTALLAWEYEGGALCIVTWAAAIHALRARIELATRRRDALSYRTAPERYLAADSIVSALEAQLDGDLEQRNRSPGSG
jgi:hypothetical protein